MNKISGTFEVVAAAASQVYMIADPSSLSNGGGKTSEITAEVYDEFYNTVEGTNVEFTGGGDGTFTNSTVTTDTNGYAVTTYTSNSNDDSSTVTITATEQAENISKMYDMTIGY